MSEKFSGRSRDSLRFTSENVCLSLYVADLKSAKIGEHCAIVAENGLVLKVCYQSPAEDMGDMIMTLLQESRQPSVEALP